MNLSPSQLSLSTPSQPGLPKAEPEKNKLRVFFGKLKRKFFEMLIGSFFDLQREVEIRCGKEEIIAIASVENLLHKRR